MTSTEPRSSATDPVVSPILLVDDRADSLLALQAVLEPLGQPILIARSGDEALRHLLRSTVAVILLDVNMPGMDGFSTAALIKRRERTQDIPIIFLTAERDAIELGQVELGYSSGAVDFIVKPFDPWVLMSKVAVFVELHRTYEQLRRQVDELKVSRTALAAAQRIARLAHFDVDVRTGAVTWSEHAAQVLSLGSDGSGDPPLESQLSFWDELIDPPVGRDASYMRTVVDRPGGSSVSLIARAEYLRDRLGRLVSIRGTLQDVTEQDQTRRALAEATDALEREQEAVTLLQTSMLPAAIPQPLGLDIAARYIPAEVGVGGDFYDVSWRADGRVMLVIGDVAGHGLSAASTMNEIRIAARAFAMRDASPSGILQELNAYAESMESLVLVTALIITLDPITGCGVAASAGHLPPLIDTGDGWRFLDITVAPPLGAGRGLPTETEFELVPNGRIVMYTDGLVEQRRGSIDDRLAELGRAFGVGDTHADALADHLVRTMLPEGTPSDDVAIVTVHRSAETRLSMRLPTDVSRLYTMRATLRRWLDEHSVAPAIADVVVLAAGELASNVCIHARPLADGHMTVEAEIEDGTLCVRVRDSGRWQAERNRGGGRGLKIVRSVVDDLIVESDDAGTTASFTLDLDGVAKTYV